MRDNIHVDAREAKGAVVGDHNTVNNQTNSNNTTNNQTTNNYHNHTTHIHQAAPSSAKTKREIISLKVAASYFNRERLFPEINPTITREDVSSVFFVGHGDDWHEGVHLCFSDRIQRKYQVNNFCATVEWPNPKKSNSTDRQYAVWLQIYEALADAFDPPEEIDTLIKKVGELLALCITHQDYALNLIRYDIIEERWNEITIHDIGCIQKQWDQLHQHISTTKTMRLRIGLFFCVTLDENQGWLASLLKKKQEKTLPTMPNLDTIAKHHESELESVGLNDIDSWVERLEATHKDGNVTGDWWVELKNQMKRQFKDEKERIPHKQLLQRLEADIAFRKALMG